MKSEKRQKFFARLQTLLMVPHQPCLLLSAVVSSSAYVASPNLTVIGQSSSPRAVAGQSPDSRRTVNFDRLGFHAVVVF